MPRFPPGPPNSAQSGNPSSEVYPARDTKLVHDVAPIRVDTLNC
jgi:hypothetical protein